MRSARSGPEELTRGLVRGACALAVAGCSLVSLDDLQEGGGAGGGATSASASTTSAGGGSTASASAAAVVASGSTTTGEGGVIGGPGGGGSTGEGGGAGAVPTSAYAEAVLESGPVVYLRLGEPEGESRARDEMQNHDGAYQPGATRGLPGALVGDPSTAVAPSTDVVPHGAVVLGDVLDFAGSADGGLAIELWLRVRTPPEKGDDFQVLVAKDPYDPERIGYMLGLFSQSDFWTLGFERFAVGPGMNARYAFDVPLTELEWHHVVASHEAASAVLYLDGEPISSGVGSAESLADTLAPLVIGANSQTNYPFTGELDEVAIYARPLLPSEVARHYEIGKTGRTPL